jgi:acyl-CoA synthetase (NDP forming)
VFGDVLGAGSVAVVGASDDPEQLGGRAFRYLRDRFSGAVHPVNPRRERVQGAAAFPTLADAPPVDLAVLAVPEARVAGAVADCAAAGVPWAVVFASGYADAGADGARRQEALVALADASGVRLVGPNTMGVVNFHTGLFATFASRLAEAVPRRGGLAVVSQSGAMGSAIMSDLAASEVPCGWFAHTGNEAEVTAADVLAAYAAEPEVRAIAAYLETVRDPHGLREALAAAAGRDLPVVVLKAGTTAAGAAAAASHTGALLGDDGALDAVLDAYGVLRVRSPGELVDVLRCLCLARRPRGRRVAVVTVTGGGGVLQADAASAGGLELPPAGPDLRARLGAILPAYASTANPFDLTGAPIADPVMLRDSLAAIDAGAGYDVVSLNFAAGERSASAFVDATAELASRSRATVVATWQGVDPATRRALASRGVPTFADPVRAMGAVSAVCRWAARTGEARGDLPPPAGGGTGDAPPGPEAVPTDAAPLGRWLAAHGVPVVPTVLVASPDEAPAAFREAGGGPVVAKLVAPGLSHRSDVGGVRLGIRTAGELVAAVEELLALARPAGAAGVRVQVQPQERGGHEVLLGLRRDPRYGWMLALGFGGVLAEVVAEVRVLPAPAGEAACRRAVASLFTGRWVRHPRGLGTDGAHAVARLASHLSSLAPAMDCTELELNPVIVRGPRAVAVDWMAAG